MTTEPKLHFTDIQLKLLVTPTLYIGLNGIRKIERASLSDFAYGQYLFFVNDKPAYYFNALSNDSDEAKIKEWCNADVSASTVGDQVLALLKQHSMKNVALSPCRHALSIAIGKESLKDLSLSKIRLEFA